MDAFAKLGKPIVGNLADCRKHTELTKSGVKILGTSALRHCDEVANVQKALRENGIRTLHMDVSVGCDEFNYAIHAIEEIYICGK